MKNVIFLGPPGCGKGTQAAMLVSHFGYIKLSTGDLLRDVAKQDTAFAKEVKDIMAQGNLVSDDIVNRLIDDFYSKNTEIKGVILDGYPRNINQAKTLEETLNKYHQKIDKVFYFDLDETILVKRITGRYSCTDCGAIYNEYFHKTKIDGKCDNCQGVNFIKRSDDSEDIIIERLKIFRNFIEELLSYYEDKLIKLEADKPKDLLSSKMIQYLL
jgi:adenylate kinase